MVLVEVKVVVVLVAIVVVVIVVVVVLDGLLDARVYPCTPVVSGHRQCHCDAGLLVFPRSPQTSLPPPLCSGGPNVVNIHQLQSVCGEATKVVAVAVVVAVVVVDQLFILIDKMGSRS